MAVATLEWPMSNVELDMPFQVRSLFPHISYFCVCFHVPLQVVSKIESFVAVATMEWSMSNMELDMPSQVRSLFPHISYFCVCLNVPLKNASGGDCLQTYTAFGLL